MCQIQTLSIYNAIKVQQAGTQRTGIVGAIEDIVGAVLGEGSNDLSFASDLLGRGLLCEATSLPSRAFQTMTQTMYGFSEQFPIAAEYVPITCTFSMPLFGTSSPIITSLENRALEAVLPSAVKVTIKTPATNPLPAFFSAWQNLIQNATNGPASGFNLRFPSEYYTTMQVITYDKQDNVSLVYAFENVYPRLVESVPVSWSADGFAKQQVSFQYSHWHLLHTNPSKLSIGLSGVPFIGGGTINF